MLQDSSGGKKQNGYRAVHGTVFFIVVSFCCCYFVLEFESYGLLFVMNE